jgi:hypothetical protein
VAGVLTLLLGRLVPPGVTILLEILAAAEQV